MGGGAERKESGFSSRTQNVQLPAKSVCRLLDHVTDGSWLLQVCAAEGDGRAAPLNRGRHWSIRCPCKTGWMNGGRGCQCGCVCVVLQLWTAQPPLSKWIRRGQPAHTPPQRPPGGAPAGSPLIAPALPHGGGARQRGGAFLAGVAAGMHNCMPDWLHGERSRMEGHWAQQAQARCDGRVPMHTSNAMPCDASHPTAIHSPSPSALPKEFAPPPPHPTWSLAAATADASPSPCIATLAPAPASARSISKPMPCVEPVTSATLPASMPAAMITCGKLAGPDTADARYGTLRPPPTRTVVFRRGLTPQSHCQLRRVEGDARELRGGQQRRPWLCC
eukprot:366256-Chlamydomonas_euryale.AAC.28